MSDTPTLPSDRQLVDAARQGHDAAWQELLERHRASLLAVLGARRRSARLIANDRIESVRGDLTTDVEGDEAVRAFRPKALAAVTGGAYGAGDVDTDEPSDPLLARAFARLPEPWQTVLWHSYVEQLSAAEVSPLVGRAASDVTDLVATAERGLVDAYALEVLATNDLDAETAGVVPLLSGFVRGALPPYEQRRVERHLALCDSEPAHEGAELARDMTTLARLLPEVLPPSIAPGITGLSVAEHRERLGTSDRAFGAATLFASRSDRTRRAIVVGSVAAVVLALVGVAYLARQPFDDDDPTSGPGDATTVAPGEATDVGTGPTTSVSDPTVPDSTDLDLRPEPTGPLNTIELVFDDGNRTVGLQATEPALGAAVTTAAPIFAGGTGTIDVMISNSSDAAADASVEFVMPRGVVLDGLVSGAAECADPVDDSPFCNVTVPANGALALSLRVALESSVVGVLRVEGDLVEGTFAEQIVATRDLIHNSVGRGDAVVIGNTVMTCADGPAGASDYSCADVVAGTGSTVNRWDVPMVFTGAAPAFGFSNGSKATLDLPPDAAIVDAHLFWSGDLQERDVSVAVELANEVTLGSPSGDVVAVAPDELAFGEEDSTQYVGRADVTDAIVAGGSGEYLVGNVAAAEVQGSYGAWALVVVYDHDALPLRHRMVTDPFDWVAPEAPFTYAVDLPVPVVAGGAAHLGVVAFEGERGFAPETFEVGGVRLGGDNPFDSTIVGARDPAFGNNLGVDIDAYDLTIDTPDGILGVTATSDKDGIRLAVLALTVDLTP